MKKALAAVVFAVLVSGSLASADVWTPSGSGAHGFLVADADHLRAAQAHVEAAAEYMRALVAP